jgi:hypothetical protein
MLINRSRKSLPHINELSGSMTKELVGHVYGYNPGVASL